MLFAIYGVLLIGGMIVVGLSFSLPAFQALVFIAGVLLIAYAGAVVFWRDPVTDLYAIYSQRNLGSELQAEESQYVTLARQEQVAVVVEVADEGGRHARVEHSLLDFRDRCCRLGKVDGDAHHLGARLGQLDALRGRRRCVGGVRHGH